MKNEKILSTKRASSISDALGSLDLEQSLTMPVPPEVSGRNKIHYDKLDSVRDVYKKEA